MMALLSFFLSFVNKTLPLTTSMYKTCKSSKNHMFTKERLNEMQENMQSSKEKWNSKIQVRGH